MIHVWYNDTDTLLFYTWLNCYHMYGCTCLAIHWSSYLSIFWGLACTPVICMFVCNWWWLFHWGWKSRKWEVLDRIGFVLPTLLGLTSRNSVSLWCVFLEYCPYQTESILWRQLPSQSPFCEGSSLHRIHFVKAAPCTDSILWRQLPSQNPFCEGSPQWNALIDAVLLHFHATKGGQFWFFWRGQQTSTNFLLLKKMWVRFGRCFWAFSSSWS